MELLQPIQLSKLSSMSRCNWVIAMLVESYRDRQVSRSVPIVSNGKHAGLCAPCNLLRRTSIMFLMMRRHSQFSGLLACRMSDSTTLGETVVATGLGLIGLLPFSYLLPMAVGSLGSIMMRKSVNSRSFGAQAVNLSESTDPVAYTLKVTNGIGVDAVLIAASSRSNGSTSSCNNV